MMLMAVWLVFATGCSKEEESNEEEGAEESQETPEGPEAPDPSTIPSTNPNPNVGDGGVETAAFEGGDETTDDIVFEGGDDETPDQVTVSRNFLRINKVLEKDDIRATTDFVGTLKVRALPGQKPSETYNAFRLGTDDSDQFGFGIQVWKPGSSGAAQKQYNALLNDSMGGKRANDVGNQSYRTEHHDLRSVVFLNSKKATVVMVTCDASLCDFDQLTALAQQVQSNVNELL